MEQKKVEIVSGAFLIGLAAFLLVYMRTQPWYTPHLSVIDDSSFFPTIVSWCIGALGAVQIAYALRTSPDGRAARLNLRGILLVAIWLVYAFVLTTLGFLAASFAAVLLSQLLWGERRMLVAIPVSAILPLVIYVVLGKILHVDFPQGIIPF